MGTIIKINYAHDLNNLYVDFVYSDVHWEYISWDGLTTDGYNNENYEENMNKNSSYYITLIEFETDEIQ